MAVSCVLRSESGLAAGCPAQCSKQRLLAPSAGLAHTSTVLALCLPRTQAAALNADRLSGLAPCQQALCEARAVCSRKTTESDFYT